MDKMEEEMEGDHLVEPSYVVNDLFVDVVVNVNKEDPKEDKIEK